MVQGFMGDDFIKGVRSYLDQYKYANAETDDLWKHLTEVNKFLKIVFLTLNTVHSRYLQLSRGSRNCSRHREFEIPSSCLA